MNKTFLISVSATIIGGVVSYYIIEMLKAQKLEQATKLAEV